MRESRSYPKSLPKHPMLPHPLLKDLLLGSFGFQLRAHSFGRSVQGYGAQGLQLRPKLLKGLSTRAPKRLNLFQV